MLFVQVFVLFSCSHPGPKHILIFNADELTIVKELILELSLIKTVHRGQHVLCSQIQAKMVGRRIGQIILPSDSMKRPRFIYASFRDILH